MDLDARSCYRALRSRDDRFDGRFFTGVVTTGVYCRPVCPARTPRAENCRFFAHAAAAAAAGFRPCLRCRPEAAPGTPAWSGTAAIVARALRLIDAGALDSDGVDSLAARVGVGDRHLRRLFLQHLGATPVAVASTRRVSFAKQLLNDTALPMRAVAQAAGFASIRRFNAAMQEAYRRPPTELRRTLRATAGANGRAAPSGGAVTLSLPFRPPFDWSALLAYLALRAIPGVEQVACGAYLRTFACDSARGVVEVRCDVARRRLRVRVVPASGTRLAPQALMPVVQRVRQMFDLAADPAAIAAHLGADAALGRHVRRRPGLRVPGAWDGFELAVRAVLGQQVSVRAATTLAGRIAGSYGTPVAGFGSALAVAFPGAATLVTARLATLGVLPARADSIRGLAREVVAGRIVLGPDADVEAMCTALRSIPGIGPWTVSYVSMRALRVPDAFPAQDLGLRRAIATLGPASRRAGRHAPALVTAAALERAAERWRPWRAYAAVHLWTGEEPDASVDR